MIYHIRVIQIPSIFIADDEEEIRNLFKEVLESKGYEILPPATNGHEAVELFLAMSEKPNLFILDNRMPVKTGLEVTLEILDDMPDARIILMSGDDKIKDEVTHDANIGVLIKPFSLMTLIEAVAYMLSEDGVRKGTDEPIRIFSN